MATTEAAKTRVMDGIKAGVSNYVIKPFSRETLLEKVRQTLAGLKVAWRRKQNGVHPVR
jgi:DNA-binding response OmpR family regulator